MVTFDFTLTFTFTLVLWIFLKTDLRFSKFISLYSVLFDGCFFVRTGHSRIWARSSHFLSWSTQWLFTIIIGVSPTTVNTYSYTVTSIYHLFCAVLVHQWTFPFSTLPIMTSMPISTHNSIIIGDNKAKYTTTPKTTWLQRQSVLN